MKRFTDTELWDKEWFMQLQPSLKCAVRYLFDKCDSAGVWNPNYLLASTLIGHKITELELLSVDDGRQFEPLESGKIYIPSFIHFQYGQLSWDCKPHRPVIEKLKKYNLYERVSKGFQYPIDRVQEKEKETDKEKDKGGAGGKENPTPAANGVPYQEKSVRQSDDITDEQFREYQQWTDMILDGTDQGIEPLLMKNKLEVIPAAMNDHIEMLSRYKHMRPATQHLFRLSVIKHLREWAGKKKEASPFAAKPQDKFYTPPPKVTEPSYDIAKTISAAPDETWTSSISRDAEKLAANPNYKPILGIKKLEYLLKKKLVEYTDEQKASYLEEAKTERMDELEADKIDSHSRRLLKEYQENNIRPEESKLLKLKSQEIAYTDYLFGEVEKLKAATA